MREHYEQIQALGAEVVAIGTGDERYAQAFVADEAVPFPVLVDDGGAAAQAASVRTIPFLPLLFDPRSWPGGLRARRAGFRIHRSGERVTQLGATFVIGPGPTVRYEHIDRHFADRAPLDAVLAHLAGCHGSPVRRIVGRPRPIRSGRSSTASPSAVRRSSGCARSSTTARS